LHPFGVLPPHSLLISLGRLDAAPLCRVVPRCARHCYTHCYTAGGGRGEFDMNWCDRLPTAWLDLGWVRVPNKPDPLVSISPCCAPSGRR
jgi:hypothetical protein